MQKGAALFEVKAMLLAIEDAKDTYAKVPLPDSDMKALKTALGNNEVYLVQRLP